VRWTVSPSATLFYLTGVRVLGEEGAVISPDNRVFADFTHPPTTSWLQHSCFLRKRIPKAKALHGWYATLCYPASRFFFHWMIESLPRMRLLAGYLGLLDGVFVPSPLQPFHLESLAAFGISRDRLISLTPNSHYAPERLFVPSVFVRDNPPTWLHKWYKTEFIGQWSLDRVSSGSSRRIYISRSDAPVRRLDNEADVAAVLKGHGFETVCLSGKSFSDQAKTFFDADIVVAPHGAGLANVVFCRPGTRVLEIFPPRWMMPCYAVLATSVGASYSCILGEEIQDEGASGRPEKANFRVSIDALVPAINRLLKLD
jgi:capsular polysaccharide biosynthesis protein